MNVPELGWSSGPYPMIARLDTWLTGYEGYLAQHDPFFGVATVLSRPDGSLDIPQPFVTFGVVGHFPYDQVVEPD